MSEIWEYFFKRDFPIVAEARAKAAKEQKSSISGDDKKTSNSSSTSRSPLKGSQTSQSSRLDLDSQDTQMESEHDDLFVSYRDLYYDEQVRREEKLASAGERLKERMHNLAQIKSSRQTILDPRLSLNLRKRRRGQTLPTGASRLHWSKKESRPKTLTEKARARASQLAFAYDPPRFTRSASMKVGFIPQKPKPVYKESSLEDMQTSQGTTKGIFGPRRGKPSIEACQAANQAFSRNPIPNTVKPTSTSFVERTVTKPPKSSIDKPYKALELPTNGIAGKSITKTTPISRSPQKNQAPSQDTLQVSNSRNDNEQQQPRSAINIPGITRRPILHKKPASEEDQFIPQNSGSISPAASPPLASATASSPPSSSLASVRSVPVPNLPMMSQPRKVPSGPSLFIPRKKAR